MSKLKIYTGQAMSGLIKADVLKKALSDKEFLQKAGFEVLSPVLEEGVENKNETLLATKQQMDSFWKRDKELIRQSHVVFDMSPLNKSEGVAHELAYARYSLWKPIIRVYPEGCLPPESSIAYYEDDAVVDSMVEAIEYTLRVHGTLFKRLTWRINLLFRCLPKWVFFQLKEWK